MKINNRKILSGIAEVIGQADKVTDLCTAMDKLDKIGQDNVCAELLERGISQESIDKLMPVFSFGGQDNVEKIEQLKGILAGSEIGMKGVEELVTVLDYVKDMGLTTDLEIDITPTNPKDDYDFLLFKYTDVYFSNRIIEESFKRRLYPIRIQVHYRKCGYP